jgi:hypothetical protein
MTAPKDGDANGVVIEAPKLVRLTLDSFRGDKLDTSLIELVVLQPWTTVRGGDSGSSECFSIHAVRDESAE